MVDFQNTQDLKEFIPEISKRINENVQRIRLLEESINSIESRINTIEQNFIEFAEENNKNKNHTTSDLSEMRDKVINLSVDVQKINRLTGKLANKNDIKEIQEYVNLIMPMTSKFVTKKETETMIKEAINQQKYNL
ncbi:MAG: hypothetical protein K0B02_05010 [DPANN group archaeon]|nr:hypothetical protein [DPANN group archaeon]